MFGKLNLIEIEDWFAGLGEDYELPRRGVLLWAFAEMYLVTSIRLLGGNKKIFLKSYNYMEWELMIYKADGDYLIGNSITGRWKNAYIVL